MPKLGYILVVLMISACTHSSNDKDSRLTALKELKARKRKLVKDTLPDGTTYKGEVLDAIPHGKGKMRWIDGLEYEGDFKLALPHGKGRYSWPSGKLYFGVIKEGLPHGLGSLTMPNGDSLVGNFYGGLEQGQFRFIEGKTGKKYYRNYDRGILQKQWKASKDDF